MTIRLYIDPGPGDIHIAGENTTEVFCGINIRKYRLVGTIDVPSSFTPQPDAIHDECLNVFLQRYDYDMSSSGENIGWEDMGQ